MRRTAWMTVGMGCAGLFLCGAETPQATDTAALRQTVLQLQSEVADMQRELAQLRSELASLNPDVGVGGSGPVQPEADTAAPASHPPTAQTQDTASPPSSPDTSKARVDALYTGTVRSVSADRLVLLDSKGEAFPIALGKNTALREANGQRISAKALTPGTPVQATVDLLSQSGNEASVITVLPSGARPEAR
jgi:hypothetical protein